MTTISQKAELKRMFRSDWRRNGSPTLTAVDPIEDWVPAGYAYDSNFDEVKHQISNTPLADPSLHWTSQAVRYIPSGPTPELRQMINIGVVPVGSAEIFIMGDDMSTIREAYRVIMNGVTYYPSNIEGEPVPEHTYARVLLERRQ